MSSNPPQRRASRPLPPIPTSSSPPAPAPAHLAPTHRFPLRLHTGPDDLPSGAHTPAPKYTPISPTPPNLEALLLAHAAQQQHHAHDASPPYTYEAASGSRSPSSVGGAGAADVQVLRRPSEPSSLHAQVAAMSLGGSASVVSSPAPSSSGITPWVGEYSTAWPSTPSRKSTSPPAHQPYSRTFTASPSTYLPPPTPSPVSSGPEETHAPPLSYTAQSSPLCLTLLRPGASQFVPVFGANAQIHGHVELERIDKVKRVVVVLEGRCTTTLSERGVTGLAEERTLVWQEKVLWPPSEPQHSVHPPTSHSSSPNRYPFTLTLPTYSNPWEGWPASVLPPSYLVPAHGAFTGEIQYRVFAKLQRHGLRLGKTVSMPILYNPVSRPPSPTPMYSSTPTRPGNSMRGDPSSISCLVSFADPPSFSRTDPLPFRLTLTTAHPPLLRVYASPPSPSPSAPALSSSKRQPSSSAQLQTQGENCAIDVHLLQRIEVNVGKRRAVHERIKARGAVRDWGEEQEAENGEVRRTLSGEVPDLEELMPSFSCGNISVSYTLHLRIAPLNLFTELYSTIAHAAPIALCSGPSHSNTTTTSSDLYPDPYTAPASIPRPLARSASTSASTSTAPLARAGVALGARSLTVGSTASGVGIREDGYGYGDDDDEDGFRLGRSYEEISPTSSGSGRAWVRRAVRKLAGGNGDG